ncbi:MAG: NADP-dependent malic enzyme [Candidatus Niyogibacteria bacterium]|nr:NADP-dependent malic enzyme [Candidatus Niyogibacteria bacterium]
MEAHKKARGKIEIRGKLSLTSKEDLSIVYTPGVAGPSRAIHDNPESAKDLTAMKNSVAIITDGSAVLGLGDIGPEAALPVMEGKALLFKTFAGIDAFPITLSVREIEDIVGAIAAIAPTFGGINLEDISAPRCFEIERRLAQELPIPVFHDDKDGVAIVVLAGLMNSLEVIRKKKENIRIVINGAGAAGTGILKLLSLWGISRISILDRGGIISDERKDLSPHKKEFLPLLDPAIKKGGLADALSGADVFIGVSVGGVLHEKAIRNMNADAVVFALANPDPEIMPEAAKRGGARIVATGRSDFVNQINNALVFPGLFKGLLDARLILVTDRMKIAVASALAGLIPDPAEEKIIPDIFDIRVVDAVAQTVKRFA